MNSITAKRDPVRGKKGLLITLEFPPQIGGVSTYLSGLFWHFPHGTLKVLSSGTGEVNFPHPIIRKELYFKRIWPRWLAAFFAAAKIVQQEPIGDIYISHVLPMGYVAILLKIFYKIPYTIFFHGMDVRLAGKSWWKKFWLKMILRQAKMVFANSEFTKKEILWSMSPVALKIAVVSPSPKIFPKTVLSRNQDIILTVARLVPRKGLDLGIAAFSLIQKKVPNAKYYIIGNGPEMGRLEAQIQQLGLQDSVHLMGAVPDATLYEFYNKASLFLFPVRGEDADVEGFGIAPLEASSYGIPVIAAKSGGVSEAVKDGETGILVPPGNVEALAQTAIFLLSNPELAKKLGEAGRVWAETFKPEAQFAKLSSFLWPELQ